MLVGLRDGEDKGQMPELGSTKASIALEKMQPEYGVLEAMREADETLRIVGYRRFDRTPQPTVPLNNDSLDGAKMILIWKRPDRRRREQGGTWRTDSSDRGGRQGTVHIQKTHLSDPRTGRRQGSGNR